MPWSPAKITRAGRRERHGRALALDGAHPDRCVLEAAEGAGRLGQREPAGPRPGRLPRRPAVAGWRVVPGQRPWERPALAGASGTAMPATTRVVSWQAAATRTFTIPEQVPEEPARDRRRDDAHPDLVGDQQDVSVAAGQGVDERVDPLHRLGPDLLGQPVVGSSPGVEVVELRGEPQGEAVHQDDRTGRGRGEHPRDVGGLDRRPVRRPTIAMQGDAVLPFGVVGPVARGGDVGDGRMVAGQSLRQGRLA